MNDYDLTLFALIIAGWMLTLAGIGVYKKKKSRKTEQHD